MNAPLQDADLAPAAPAARRGRRVWWIIGIVALVILLLIGLRYRASHTAAPVGGRGLGGPLAVGVAKVGTGDVPITVNALGTVTPLATVTVTPMVAAACRAWSSAVIA